MIKRLVVLLIASAALGGGFYALRGKKVRKRQEVAPGGPLLLPEAPTLLQLPAPTYGPPVPIHEHHPFFVTPRVVGLLAVAAVFSLGAYLGLGHGHQVTRASASTIAPAAVSNLPAAAPYSINADDVAAFNLRSLGAPLAATQAPAAPTPAVAAEVATPPAPTPQPTPVITRVPRAIPTDGFEAIICALPWPCAQAVAVASCESGTDMQGRLDGTWATNGNNYGLFQINGVHANRWADFYDNWMDPAKNAEWAYEIWAQQGWYPWDCRWAAYS